MSQAEELGIERNFQSIVKEGMQKTLSPFNFDFLSSSLIAAGTQDSHVEVKYIGKIGLLISYYIYEYTLGIGLVRLERESFPETVSFLRKPGMGIGVTLGALVEFRTHREFHEPLLNPGPKATNSQIKNGFSERKKIIEKDFQKVVEVYLSHLTSYATDILQGNTSCFEQVQAEYTKKMHREYSWNT